VFSLPLLVQSLIKNTFGGIFGVLICHSQQGSKLPDAMRCDGKKATPTSTLELPHLQHVDATDHWTVLVGHRILRFHLTRPIVQDQPLPRQRYQLDIAPWKVKRGIETVYSTNVNPDQTPKTRGIPPGYAKRQAKEDLVSIPASTKGSFGS